ncbi:uncharacterized protein N7459_005355 [Penicillium hispanicum]|uniref:uncharacterized protein n=1 Tax=Penicillium hispanicum TaxID=1080232 RepID=UPI0025416B61|nr:uncharacterized protein N7459_005355 [Penicillium hispanicum]KAJ5585555.1 hypothetical protein N7459_005355 [Penicillium hispanicum]
MSSWEPMESPLTAAWTLHKHGDLRRSKSNASGPSTTAEAVTESPDIAPNTSEEPGYKADDVQSRTNAAEIDNSPGIFYSLIPVGVFGKSLVDGGFLKQEIALLEGYGWIRTHTHSANRNIQIYVDPRMTDRRNSQRSVTKLRQAFRVLMAKIDCSPEAWKGQCDAHRQDTNIPNGVEDESLWYIFNTLKNPDPDLEAMKDPWSRRAMDDLLSGDDFSDLGLKTSLYPYQRRSAATMIQREAQPKQMLDPRLQACRTPTGVEYYYDKEDGCISREKILYSEARGGEYYPFTKILLHEHTLICMAGILAETMGCGKTLICLAVIWATRGHVPQIPIEYLSPPDKPDPTPIRAKTGSLMDMAAAAAGRNSLPWKSFFFEKQQERKFYHRCIKACEFHCGSYEIPPHQTRYQGRHSVSYPRPPAQRIRLCSGTLVVVPNNLVDHWQREIATHTEGLKVLTLRLGSDKVPQADQLLDFDIVLFSKSRFEAEAGEPVHNRRDRFVHVDSPLTDLHWLRVIVDEGHNVAGHGSKTNMIHLLDKLHFERRWVISGTPSTGLYGVEVSLASQEVNTSDTETPEQVTAAALRGRKKTGNAINNEMKDLDRLRRIVIEFLDLKPWSNSRANDPADWTKYIKPIGEDGKRRKTPAIRATLQSLVVRHQLNMVNREITLPQLYNRVVHLEPTLYDRLSINLFLFQLAVNTITSERQGPDYIFDPSNKKHLNQTVNNLRQAGFWWVGSDVNLQDTIDHATKYVEANREKMTAADVDQLTQGTQIARRALESNSWTQFKLLQELGIFVLNFPTDHRTHWALSRDDPDDNPLLIGITQARRAQQFITQNLRLSDPTQGLAGAGIKARSDLVRRDQRTTTKGAPESSNTPTTPGQLNHSSKPRNNKSPQKTFARNLFRTLPESSPLAKTQFVATASAKLTYLLDRVIELHQEEKIIIFYDNNNSAFWIAEGLELLGIEFRIYASTLKPELRTEYLKLFREENDVRVLLMDLRQASHGLHIAQASRVFIVNPIWQPNVESQAIKRAHRIGQTRPVYVETLVLRNTLEDRMLRRRKEMSEAEMQHAEKSLLDDTAMSDIIQKEPFLPMPDKDEAGAGAAYLRHPTGFFDRHRLPIPDEEEVVIRNPAKRAQPSSEDSDADSDDVPNRGGLTHPRQRPRIGFASTVEVVGFRARPVNSSPDVSVSPSRSSLSPFPPLDGNQSGPRRVSLFGS